MDLIEVLWKQDVDLGFTLDDPVGSPLDKSVSSSTDPDPKEPKEADENFEKLKSLEAANATELQVSLEVLICIWIRIVR